MEMSGNVHAPVTMKQTPCRWNPVIHHSLSLDPVLSQVNPLCTFLSCL